MKTVRSCAVPRVLTVAGSDSGGGAGVQADLKTISFLGGYAMTVVTALTAQNTRGVQEIFEVPAEFVARQMDAVLSDIGADALKTGMLNTPGIVRTVSRKIRHYRISRVVVDPVMTAKGGARLLGSEAAEALKRELIPIAQIVTPNVPEAEALTGIEIAGPKEMRRAARKICSMGARGVVVKGGHLAGDPVDLFFDGRTFHEFPSERIPTAHTHGTGCTFSAVLAVELARGRSSLEAVKTAKDFTASAIRFSLPLGKGHGPVNPMAPAARDAERFRILEALKRAFALLRGKRIGPLIPEVGANLGYALAEARGLEDVAAFPGRIRAAGAAAEPPHGPEFGASRHMAAVILTALRRDPQIRSAMNIRYSEDILAAAGRAGFSLRGFDRAKQPARGKELSGFPFSWGVDLVLKNSAGTPDMIYDRGGIGKEAMIRVLGRDPEDVAGKIVKLSRFLPEAG